MNINNKFIEANADLERLLQTAPSFQIADNVTQLQELACQNMVTDRFEVKYDLPNGDTVHEVTVVRVKNGIAVNYTEPCTKENPSYGILGLLHILPPALAWLWRLVAPRGFSNPSIVDTGEMSSEGVGSYWPFATGSKVKQANLLLEQFKLNSQTRNILIPNQHVGAWNVSFMPQWLTREYLARRGNAQFQHDQLVEARSPLLGYAMKKMRIEGIRISNWFLTVDTQPEIGPEVYDKGAEILQQFFVDNIRHFQKPDLDVVGRQIIECCMDRGGVTDYENFFPNYAAIHTDD